MENTQVGQQPLRRSAPRTSSSSSLKQERERWITLHELLRIFDMENLVNTLAGNLPMALQLLILRSGNAALILLLDSAAANPADR